MSIIFNQLVKHRIEQFNRCNPEGSGKHDVKPGQVVIHELYPKRIGVTGETMFCDANWRPDDKSPFLQGLAFRMNTDVLYNSASRSKNKKVPVHDLVNKVVCVTNPGIMKYLRKNRKSLLKYNVTWEITDEEPNQVILTPKAAGVYALTNTGREAEKLGEAMENFYEQCGQYLKDAACDEGYIDFDIDSVDL
ncbi:hypothetical protein ACFQZS_14025 [Mucilaginibacter calamicampi]|uniref:Uncharacterized protein n=1 Tax=Mucilaginibacter calamicampi TaxID=1302352 RepID=A0ABW2YYG6_9SPHI